MSRLDEKKLERAVEELLRFSKEVKNSTIPFFFLLFLFFSLCSFLFFSTNHDSPQRRKRNFVETIDLQIALKNIDIWSERRFNGSIVLDTKTKYKRSCCVFGNQVFFYFEFFFSFLIFLPNISSHQFLSNYRQIVRGQKNSVSIIRALTI